MIESFTGEHAFLSNFYQCVIEFRGLVFESAEAAYQSMKCADRELRPLFQEYSPGKAKREGKRVERRPDWDQVKVDIMSEILAIKFARGTRLAQRLMATHPTKLVEGNWWGDKFWGVCGGVGKNRLGELLMEQREKLMSSPS